MLTIKLLGENIDTSLFDLRLSNSFLDIECDAKVMKESINWTTSKMKAFIRTPMLIHVDV